MPRKRGTTAIAGSTRTAVDVLLTDYVPTLGEPGKIVRVKPGYARNFLLPQGLATVATEHNKRMVAQHGKRLEELQRDRIKDLKKLASEISEYSVTLDANANKDGHLYGSIVAVDISKALDSAGFSVPADNIKLEGPLRELGMYTIKIELDAQVNTEVKVWVVPSAVE